MPWHRKKRNRDETFWHKSAVTGQAMQLSHNIAGIFSVSWDFLGDASKNLGSWKQKILGDVRRSLGMAFATQNSEEVLARYIRRLENVCATP